MNWLITSTTYGTWLPGDPRGFVGRVWESRTDDPSTESQRIEHDEFGTPYDEDIAGLHQASQERLKGPPIYFNNDHAEVILKQFQETAQYRTW